MAVSVAVCAADVWRRPVMGGFSKGLLSNPTSPM